MRGSKKPIEFRDERPPLLLAFRWALLSLSVALVFALIFAVVVVVSVAA